MNQLIFKYKAARSRIYDDYYTKEKSGKTITCRSRNCRRDRALTLILVVPWLLTDFRLSLLGRFLALSIAALGIDLIWGYTGLLSLGHGVFFALGGYLLAMYLKLQIPTDASNQLPEFMNLYGLTELPAFWQPFHNFGFTIFAILFIPTTYRWIARLFSLSQSDSRCLFFDSDASCYRCLF